MPLGDPTWAQSLLQSRAARGASGIAASENERAYTTEPPARGEQRPTYTIDESLLGGVGIKRSQHVSYEKRPLSAAGGNSQSVDALASFYTNSDARRNAVASAVGNAGVVPQFAVDNRPTKLTHADRLSLSRSAAHPTQPAVTHSLLELAGAHNSRAPAKTGSTMHTAPLLVRTAIAAAPRQRKEERATFAGPRFDLVLHPMQQGAVVMRPRWRPALAQDYSDNSDREEETNAGQHISKAEDTPHANTSVAVEAAFTAARSGVCAVKRRDALSLVSHGYPSASRSMKCGGSSPATVRVPPAAALSDARGFLAASLGGGFASRGAVRLLVVRSTAGAKVSARPNSSVGAPAKRSGLGNHHSKQRDESISDADVRAAVDEVFAAWTANTVLLLRRDLSLFRDAEAGANLHHHSPSVPAASVSTPMSWQEAAAYVSEWALERCRLFTTAMLNLTHGGGGEENSHEDDAGFDEHPSAANAANSRNGGLPSTFLGLHVDVRLRTRPLRHRRRHCAPLLLLMAEAASGLSDTLDLPMPIADAARCPQFTMRCGADPLAAEGAAMEAVLCRWEALSGGGEAVTEGAAGASESVAPFLRLFLGEGLAEAPQNRNGYAPNTAASAFGFADAAQKSKSNDMDALASLTDRISGALLPSSPPMNLSYSVLPYSDGLGTSAVTTMAARDRAFAAICAAYQTRQAQRRAEVAGLARLMVLLPMLWRRVGALRRRLAQRSPAWRAHFSAACCNHNDVPTADAYDSQSHRHNTFATTSHAARPRAHAETPPPLPREVIDEIHAVAYAIAPFAGCSWSPSVWKHSLASWIREGGGGVPSCRCCSGVGGGQCQAKDEYRKAVVGDFTSLESCGGVAEGITCGGPTVDGEQQFAENSGEVPPFAVFLRESVNRVLFSLSALATAAANDWLSASLVAEDPDGSESDDSDGDGSVAAEGWGSDAEESEGGGITDAYAHHYADAHGGGALLPPHKGEAAYGRRWGDSDDDGVSSDLGFVGEETAADPVGWRFAFRLQESRGLNNGQSSNASTSDFCDGAAEFAGMLPVVSPVYALRPTIADEGRSHSSAHPSSVGSPFFGEADDTPTYMSVPFRSLCLDSRHGPSRPPHEALAAYAPHDPILFRSRYVPQPKYSTLRDAAAAAEEAKARRGQGGRLGRPLRLRPLMIDSLRDRLAVIAALGGADPSTDKAALAAAAALRLCGVPNSTSTSSSHAGRELRRISVLARNEWLVAVDCRPAPQCQCLVVVGGNGNNTLGSVEPTLGGREGRGLGGFDGSDRRPRARELLTALLDMQRGLPSSSSSVEGAAAALVVVGNGGGLEGAAAAHNSGLGGIPRPSDADSRSFLRRLPPPAVAALHALFGDGGGLRIPFETFTPSEALRLAYRIAIVVMQPAGAMAAAAAMGNADWDAATNTGVSGGLFCFGGEEGPTGVASSPLEMMGNVFGTSLLFDRQGSAGHLFPAPPVTSAGPLLCGSDGDGDAAGSQIRKGAVRRYWATATTAYSLFYRLRFLRSLRPANALAVALSWLGLTVARAAAAGRPLPTDHPYAAHLSVGDYGGRGDAWSVSVGGGAFGAALAASEQRAKRTEGEGLGDVAKGEGPLAAYFLEALRREGGNYYPPTAAFPSSFSSSSPTTHTPAAEGNVGCAADIVVEADSGLVHIMTPTACVRLSLSTDPAAALPLLLPALQASLRARASAALARELQQRALVRLAVALQCHGRAVLSRTVARQRHFSLHERFAAMLKAKEAAARGLSVALRAGAGGAVGNSLHASTASVFDVYGANGGSVASVSFGNSAHTSSAVAAHHQSTLPVIGGAIDTTAARRAHMASYRCPHSLAGGGGGHEEEDLGDVFSAFENQQQRQSTSHSAASFAGGEGGRLGRIRTVAAESKHRSAAERRAGSQQKIGSKSPATAGEAGWVNSAWAPTDDGAGGLGGDESSGSSICMSDEGDGSNRSKGEGDETDPIMAALFGPSDRTTKGVRSAGTSPRGRLLSPENDTRGGEDNDDGQTAVVNGNAYTNNAPPDYAAEQSYASTLFVATRDLRHGMRHGYGGGPAGRMGIASSSGGGDESPPIAPARSKGDHNDPLALGASFSGAAAAVGHSRAAAASSGGDLPPALRASIRHLVSLEGHYRSLISEERHISFEVGIRQAYSRMFPLAGVQNEEVALRRRLFSQRTADVLALFAECYGGQTCGVRAGVEAAEEAARHRLLHAARLGAIGIAAAAEERQYRSSLITLEAGCFAAYGYGPCAFAPLLTLLALAAEARHAVTAPPPLTPSSGRRIGLSSLAVDAHGGETSEPLWRFPSASGGAGGVGREAMLSTAAAAARARATSVFTNAPAATTTAANRPRADSFSSRRSVSSSRRDAFSTAGGGRAATATATATGAVLVRRRLIGEEAAQQRRRAALNSAMASLFEDCFSAMNEVAAREAQLRAHLYGTVGARCIFAAERHQRTAIEAEADSAIRAAYVFGFAPRSVQDAERRGRERLFFTSVLELQALQCRATVAGEEAQQRDLITVIGSCERRQVSLGEWHPPLSLLDLAAANSGLQQALREGVGISRLQQMAQHGIRRVLGGLERERDSVMGMISTIAAAEAEDANRRHAEAAARRQQEADEAARRQRAEAAAVLRQQQMRTAQAYGYGGMAMHAAAAAGAQAQAAAADQQRLHVHAHIQAAQPPLEHHMPMMSEPTAMHDVKDMAGGVNAAAAPPSARVWGRPTEATIAANRDAGVMFGDAPPRREGRSSAGRAAAEAYPFSTTSALHSVSAAAGGVDPSSFPSISIAFAPPNGSFAPPSQQHESFAQGGGPHGSAAALAMNGDAGANSEAAMLEAFGSAMEACVPRLFDGSSVPPKQQQQQQQHWGHSMQHRDESAIGNRYAHAGSGGAVLTAEAPFLPHSSLARRKSNYGAFAAATAQQSSRAADRGLSAPTTASSQPLSSLSASFYRRLAPPPSANSANNYGSPQQQQQRQQRPHASHDSHTAASSFSYAPQNYSFAGRLVSVVDTSLEDPTVPPSAASANSGRSASVSALQPPQQQKPARHQRVGVGVLDEAPAGMTALQTIAAGAYSPRDDRAATMNSESRSQQPAAALASALSNKASVVMAGAPSSEVKGRNRTISFRMP